MNSDTSKALDTIGATILGHASSIASVSLDFRTDDDPSKCTGDCKPNADYGVTCRCVHDDDGCHVRCVSREADVPRALTNLRAKLSQSKAKTVDQPITLTARSRPPATHRTVLADLKRNLDSAALDTGTVNVSSTIEHHATHTELHVRVSSPSSG